MPGDRAERREVGDQLEVAVAAIPGSERVAADRVHLDIDRQQVVAGLRSVLGDRVQEVADVHALALEAALHVCHPDQDGVDLAAACGLPELVERHRPRTLHPCAGRVGEA
ncbi:MAG: hypothetical protein V9E83_00010 [Baekduia sp.]